jgi:cell division protein FtsZ
MENRVGLNFGFIGVGQCGGNIANEFSKLGYKAIALNTSLTDLAKLDNIQKNNRLLINVGVQGAGKNPEIGRKALEEHIEEVMHLIEQVFDTNHDMLFVCAGLGGGTGSGIAPLLTQILSEQGFNVGMIVTIPSGIESPKVKIVALNAFEELSQIENISSVFVVDNAKATQLPSQMGIKTKYGIVNENVAIKLHEINRMTTYASDMAFDARDFQTLIETRGCGSITSIKIDDVSELKETEVLAQSVKKALASSIYADTNYLHAKGCAFLFELPDGGSHYITEEALSKMQKELGTPFEVFTGVYENKNRKREVTLHVVVTGLPFPLDRLGAIQNELEGQAENIQNLFEVSQKQSFTGNGKTLLNKFISPTTAPKEPKVAGESTLDKLLKKKKNG